MDFFDVIKKRASIRSFKERLVSDDQVEQLLKVANSAPSAGNLQSYRILVIKNDDLKDKLVKAAHGQKFIGKAPVNFVFLRDVERAESKYGERAELYSLQDGTIAATYLQLAAVDLGLGSCWVGSFIEEKVKEHLDTTKKPLAIIPVGYPAQRSRADSARRELEEMVTFLD